MNGANKLSNAQKIEIALDTLRPELLTKARKSLLAFILASKADYEVNWHHKLITNKLMQWMRGDFENLIIETPPRHGKTEIGSKHLPAFIFGQEPDAKVIATSYSADLAETNSRAVQEIMGSESYSRIFPFTSLPRAAEKKPTGGFYKKTSKEFEIVNRTGQYRAAGVGGPITGKGANYLIIDDPFKGEEQSDSIVYREKIWNWWESVAMSRLEQKARVLLIMTRWHEDDLAGRLLAKAKSDPLAMQFEELKLPAIKDLEGVVYDPRDIGEPLWIDKYPVDRLNMIKASISPRWWNSLYQQKPTALEGGIIKKRWFKYYTVMPPRFTKIIQTWDLSFNDNNTSDFVVGMVLGVWEGNFYLLDMVRGRWGFVSSSREIDLLSRKWPAGFAKLIEKKANGDAIIDSLKRKGLNEDGSIRQPIMGLIPITPTESKGARLEAISPLYAAGNVYHPHPSIAPWINIVEDELVSFPNGTHDDCVDTLSQGLNHLAGRSTSILDKISKM